MVKISPSVLSANFLDLKEQIEKLEQAGVDMWHLDVMDGIFVPNISFGVPVIKSIKKYAKAPLDVHLMIDRPHRYIKEFAEVSDYLGFHYEAGSDVAATLKEIREYGCKSCLTIKPCTEPEEIFEFLPLCDMVLVMSVEPGFGGQKFMPSALPKLEKLKEEIKRQNLNVELEIDGGINAETAKLAVNAGASVLVAGSFIFSAEDMNACVDSLKNGL
ncbi:MAG: ribulose-phosphate 3-epimerase [Clostridia bacterium]|nr:ribulose-phosphate 3-epimerase [Oscillospiraceae bacterium]MBQ2746695.1 ribulose-phosphate 3-epimerase [Clostridia bacterium]